jgi:hypothetical protein
MNAKRSWASLAVVLTVGAGGGRPAAAGPRIVRFEVAPTVFLVREAGGLKQRFEATIENDGDPAPAEIVVRTGAASARFPIAAVLRGADRYAFFLPEPAKPATADIRLRCGGEERALKLRLFPPRKWTVHLFHHSHSDIGYTELQTRVARNHADYLDAVIRYCRETEGYPDGAVFKWNVEIAWSLEQLLRFYPEERMRELMELVKAGRVELGAWYLQLSDAFSHEGLVRSVYLARDWARRYGVPLVSAMNNDVTGFSWAAPQVLAKAGVKYFATGINETRSRAPLRRPNAFYWESPDGSRILHWNGEHYLFANYELRLHEGCEAAAPKIRDYLARLEARGDYPYDLIAFNVGGRVTDNCPPGRHLSDIVKDWNERWAWPRLRLATMSEFFGALESRYGSGLPVYKLGWPDYWTDGVASTAFETGLNRTAHNDFASGEAWAALAASANPAYAYPAGEIREGLNESMLYDEHTWGAWNSIDDPHSELARGQWTLKSAFAYGAREKSRHVKAGALAALAPRLPASLARGLAVFNPLSWERTGPVRAVLPEDLARSGERFKLIDLRSSAEVPSQIVDGNAVLFVAGGIPALGYAVYGLVPAPDPPPGEAAPAVVIKDDAIESGRWKVRLDPYSGGVASLVDKAAGAELADTASGYALNQYVYENPRGGRKAVDDMSVRPAFNRASPTSARLEPRLKGPVAWSLVARSTPRGCRSLEQEVIVYDGLDRVDIVDTLDKEEVFEPEAVYFAFPFAMPAPRLAFEIADGWMAPEADQLPGTTRDWHTVQSWVEAAGADRSVVWSPVEAPLVQFCDINTGKWLKTLDVRNAHVYSYAMNNYWMTNFKAAQDGRVSFRYSLTSRAGGRDPIASTRFGWETHHPLEAVWLAPGGGTVSAGTALSYLGVDAPGVVLQALKKAEDGDGWVLRLREVAGRPSDARLSGALIEPGATLEPVGIAEDAIPGAPLLDAGAPIRVPAFAIVTLRLRPARAGGAGPRPPR